MSIESKPRVKKRQTPLRYLSNIFATSDTHSACLVKNDKGSFWVEFPDCIDVDFSQICDKQVNYEVVAIPLSKIEFNTLDSAFEHLTSLYSNPVGFYQNTPSFLIGYCTAHGIRLQERGILC